MGSRFKIPTTRAIISAIQSGDLADAQTETLPGLNLAIPTGVTGVDSDLLNPRDTWSDKSAYDEAARALIAKFVDNFTKFEVDAAIIKAGPDSSY